jgi:hypothetical protein
MSLLAIKIHKLLYKKHTLNLKDIKIKRASKRQVENAIDLLVYYEIVKKTVRLEDGSIHIKITDYGIENYEQYFKTNLYERILGVFCHYILQF